MRRRAEIEPDPKGEAGFRRAREACSPRAWGAALPLLSRLNADGSLGAEDLGRLATAARLTNRDDACLKPLERCHLAWLDRGDAPAAARAAFWLGFRLAGRGEIGLATGWLARARRVIEGADCVEHGYLLLPDVEQSLGGGD